MPKQTDIELLHSELKNLDAILDGLFNAGVVDKKDGKDSKGDSSPGSPDPFTGFAGSTEWQGRIAKKENAQ